jgi:hypothetical protein
MSEERFHDRIFFAHVIENRCNSLIALGTKESKKNVFTSENCLLVEKKYFSQDIFSSNLRHKMTAKFLIPEHCCACASPWTQKCNCSCSHGKGKKRCHLQKMNSNGMFHSRCGSMEDLFTVEPPHLMSMIQEHLPVSKM